MCQYLGQHFIVGKAVEVDKPKVTAALKLLAHYHYIDIYRKAYSDNNNVLEGHGDDSF